MNIITWIEEHFLPVLKFAANKELQAAQELADDVIARAKAGDSYTSLIALVVSEGKAKEIDILEQTALFALNTAENKLIAAGTPAPITVAATQAAVTATPATVVVN